MSEQPQQLASRFAATILTALLPTVLATAQQAGKHQDPVGKPVLARTFDRESGRPQPDVDLHITQKGMDAPRLDANGCLIAEDIAVRRLRASSTVRTDATGTATLRMDPTYGRIRVGEPFFLSATPKRIDGVWQIQVGQRKPVDVQAFGADGEPIAGLAVAVHSDGKDIAVALTDKTGRARLGVPHDVSARVAIAPAGWVGPKQNFPSVAGSLAGRRKVVLQVPLHGSLCLRRVRSGLLQKHAITSLEFFDPDAYARWSMRPQVNGNATGIVFPMVAIGKRLSCYTPFGGQGTMTLEGPRKANEARVIDIDIGPVLTMQIAGVPEQVLRNVRVRVVTDQETLKAYARRQRDGRFAVDFHRGWIGNKLIRVELDAANHTAVLHCDHALRTTAIDIGTVRLVARPPKASSAKKPTNVRGELIARVRNTKVSRRLPRLASKFGTKSADQVQNQADGTAAITFSNLRPGSYRLLVEAPDRIQTVALDGIPVAADGTCNDARLQDIDCKELLRKVSVHVVDADGVPIAGATIQSPHLTRSTDGTGTAEFYLGRGATFNATIAAPGMRTQRRTDWPDKLTIKLEPESLIRLRIVGLPKDLPREGLEVWLRDEVRERFAGPRGQLGQDDTITLSLPPRGGYLPTLLVVTKKARGSTSWSTLYVHPKIVMIDKPTDESIEMRIDAATVERLRTKGR